MSFDHRLVRRPQDPSLRRHQFGRVQPMLKPSLYERTIDRLRAMVRTAR